MKTAWLCSALVLTASAAVFAQTAGPVATDAPKIISVTGCVANGTKSDTVTLTHAMVLPFGSPTFGPEPLSAAEPSAPAQSGPPSRTSAIPGAVGTSGTISGTAPAGSSASSVDGYRLSGVDMTVWIGRRVQVVGTVEPPRQAVLLDIGQPPAAPTLHVMSVQPVTGPCSK
jgi:hypothetical protein